MASPPILLHSKRTQCSGIPKSRRFGEFGIKITAFNWGGGEGRGGETTFVSSYREVRKNGAYHDTFENRHIFYGSIVVFMTKKPSFFFQMLCERLLKMYQQSVMIAEGEACDKQQRKQATAIALRLKAPSEIDLEEYYPAFLDMIRNLLDGKLE